MGGGGAHDDAGLDAGLLRILLASVGLLGVEPDGPDAALRPLVLRRIELEELASPGEEGLLILFAGFR